MKIKIENDRLLVKPFKSDVFSMEADQKKGECCGTIIDKGSGFVFPDLTVKPIPYHIGDNIVFGVYSGTHISINGEPHLIMRESDIYFSYSE